MKYEPVIGLEVHVQLNTQTKLFCACPAEFGAEPNSNTCPICQGYPGVLPVFNKEVLKKAIQAGLATECQISSYSKFDRKNYFYPDLPKAYQISQYDLPICKSGKIRITLEDKTIKEIRINRIHIEEDAGKLIHSDTKGVNESYVDLNRCGTPLLEIVSEPDMRNSQEAYTYLAELKQILEYIRVSDCDMEKGSFRCDANVSIRPVGQKEFGTRAEVKNMNSLSNVKKAIEYEIKRQSKLLDKGEKVVQETRLYDADKDATYSMRSKEEAHDYRYFPDPDLVPVEVQNSYIEDLKSRLPELPQQKRKRYVTEFEIPEYDAEILTANLELAGYYEAAVAVYPKDPKRVSNWIMSEMMKFLNEQNVRADQFVVSPKSLAELFLLQDEGKINGKIAKTVFEKMVQTGENAQTIIEKEGLIQVSDTGEIEAVIVNIIKNNPGPAEQYRSGKTNVLGFFVGQVMKETRGKANPQVVNELLVKHLS